MSLTLEPSAPEPLLDAQWLWPLLVERAKRSGDAVMLVDQDGRQFTFDQVRSLAEGLAADLFAQGLGQHSTVAWQLPTTPETLIISLALSRLSVTQAPIIHIYRGRELEFILAQTDADALITRSLWRGVDYGALAAEVTTKALADRGQKVGALVVDRDLPQRDPIMLPPWQPPAGDQLGWCYYTSGTTADPKGVRHSDRTLLAGSAALGQVITFSAQDVGSIAFPFAHIGGPTYLGTVLMYGIPVVLMEQFTPAEAVALFRRWGVTVAGGTTAFYLALLNEHRQHPNEPFIPTLRVLCGGGAPKPPIVYHQIKEELGIPVVHGWGMTECPMICSGRLDDSDEQLAHTEGRSVPGAAVKVVDAGVAADGQAGRLLVRGTMLFGGYVDQTLNDACFDAEGWFDTGDLGFIREDGHLVMAGRSKDVIIRKGETLSPQEIEDVISRHPEVAEVAVVGLADPERGELICAVVLPATPGAGQPSLEELVAFCREGGLINQKLPEQLVLMEEFPRNALGKVVKAQLRQALAS